LLCAGLLIGLIGGTNWHCCACCRTFGLPAKNSPSCVVTFGTQPVTLFIRTFLFLAIAFSCIHVRSRLEAPLLAAWPGRADPPTSPSLEPLSSLASCDHASCEVSVGGLARPKLGEARLSAADSDQASSAVASLEPRASCHYQLTALCVPGDCSSAGSCRSVVRAGYVRFS
jgi:hypothetical protein